MPILISIYLSPVFLPLTLPGHPKKSQNISRAPHCIQDISEHLWSLFFFTLLPFHLLWPIMLSRNAVHGDFALFFEGSPHLTIPSQNPIFHPYFFQNCRKFMRPDVSLCIFGDNCWSSFCGFGKFQKTSVASREWQFKRFFIQKRHVFCFRFWAYFQIQSSFRETLPRDNYSRSFEA